MDEFTADAFANRDEPIPLLSVNLQDVSDSSSDVESSRRRDKVASRLKDKVQEVRDGKIEPGTPDRQSLQDRLFAKLLSQVIPSEDLDYPEDDKVDRRSSKYVARPAFSLPVMTNNFRRFNARIGIVFVFQNRLIRLFGWRTTTHTLSFLAVYTFVCLDPYLVVALPLAVALLFIMVPAFISRHPPPPTPAFTSSATSDQYDAAAAYNYSGPALAPPRTIKPAAETSKDFFRNMRDLQNSMADFSNLHDALVSVVAPATNFSNEVLSSTIFLYLTILTTSLFIAAHLIPLRFLLLVGGWALTISGHPQVQIWLAKQQKKAERKLASEKQSISILGIPIPINPTTIRIKKTVSALSQISLSTTPETREVEIFELQYRPLLPAYSSSSATFPNQNPSALEWQPHLFTPLPYDPLSPSRIAGDRPKGTRFFEDVVPPAGWEWAGKKWELDLESGEWVSERLIVGVEYDVMHHPQDDDADNGSEDGTRFDDNDDVHDAETSEPETFAAQARRKQSVNLDFGGWVWDLPPAIGTSGNRDEEVWLAYGDYDIPSLMNEKEKKKEDKKKGHKRGQSTKGSLGKDWEESIRYDNKGRTGEWRRRRWVRVVRRVSFSGGVEGGK